MLTNMKLIYFIIAIEGFISISMEIIAIRQVSPFVGTNVVNTSIVIGSFLLFLSFGYWKGSFIKDNYFYVLSKNLLISLVFFSIGFSYLFIEQLYIFINNSYIFLIIFSSVILGPIIYLLGQTVPILSNLFDEETNGRTSGKILFYSTFGSFLGSIGTAALSIGLFGVSITIVVVSIVMLILIIIVSRKFKSYFIEYGFIILVIGIVLNLYQNQIFLSENTYSNIRVFQKDVNTTLLSVNRSHSSSFNKNTNSNLFWYITQINQYIQKKTNQDIIIAGAGGFTIGINNHNNNFTYIDINPDLRHISEEFLLSQKINGKFIAEDIRSFIKKTDKTYDIFISDVYSNIMSIPPLLATKEYFLDIKNILNKDAIAIFNIVSKSDFGTDYSQHINQTINSVFNCIAIPKNLDDTKLVNILYYCKVKKDNIIYTDDNVKLFDF